MRAVYLFARSIMMCALLTTSGAIAAAPAQPIAFDSPGAFNVSGRNLSIENGVVYLDSADNDGFAWLNGVKFTSGRISIEVKGADLVGRSFVGLAFHASADRKHSDVVYVRPFNFQPADAQRRARALQYQALPENAWNVLREQFPGKYEAAVSPAPKPEDWVRLTIEVRDGKARVFVNDLPSPALVVDLLNTNAGDGVALWVGNNSDGRFRNLRIARTK